MSFIQKFNGVFECGVKKGGWENEPFSNVKHQYVENGRRYVQSNY